MDLSTGLLSLVLKEFKTEYKTPWLCEVWNWEGDQSVLPYKWAEIISKALGEEAGFTIDFLKKNYITCPSFDKNGFFFITSRSKVIGSVYLNRRDEKPVLEFLCVEPSNMDKVEIN